MHPTLEAIKNDETLKLMCVGTVEALFNYLHEKSPTVSALAGQLAADNVPIYELSIFTEGMLGDFIPRVHFPWDIQLSALIVALYAAKHDYGVGFIPSFVRRGDRLEMPMSSRIARIVTDLMEDERPSKPEPATVTLATLQRELAPWVEHNFGERPSWQPLLGLQEEIGELAHAYLKRAQGIRTNENHDEGIRDAVADITIFLCDFCNAEGIDLEAEISKTWGKVKQRDWKKDSAKAGV